MYLLFHIYVERIEIAGAVQNNETPCIIHSYFFNTNLIHIRHESQRSFVCSGNVKYSFLTVACEF